ncbi:Flowering time control protein FPA [Senna tora]|uniref:Flowering time control protein FPA n=1 Tax=Senna tora TaxID=362788 RepID=A0A835CAA5_9FABA|nr:Flowering time control protein FPA [Senna tora]
MAVQVIGFGVEVGANSLNYGRGGGRDRFRRDYPSRFEDKSNSGRSNNNNPPSRHIWVGNLPHTIVENDLAHHFLQFGPLESVAFQPGRSYAFINFKRDEDAIDALNALQGFPLAGNPLRIEFAKAQNLGAPNLSCALGN